MLKIILLLVFMFFYVHFHIFLENILPNLKNIYLARVARGIVWFNRIIAKRFLFFVKTMIKVFSFIGKVLIMFLIVFISLEIFVGGESNHHAFAILSLFSSIAAIRFRYSKTGSSIISASKDSINRALGLSLSIFKLKTYNNLFKYLFCYVKKTISDFFSIYKGIDGWILLVYLAILSAQSAPFLGIHLFGIFQIGDLSIDKTIGRHKLAIIFLDLLWLSFILSSSLLRNIRLSVISLISGSIVTLSYVIIYLIGIDFNKVFGILKIREDFGVLLQAVLNIIMLVMAVIKIKKLKYEKSNFSSSLNLTRRLK